MRRTADPNIAKRRMNINQRLEKVQMMQAIASRRMFRGDADWQYGEYRKVYQALGYPDESKLDFRFFYQKYDRQDIATAIIDRPVDATWRGALKVMGPDDTDTESTLMEEWNALNEKLKVVQMLNRADKLAGIGHYMVLLLGFSDAREATDLKRPVGGTGLELLYLRPYPENKANIKEYETRTNEERYGLPLTYELEMDLPGQRVERDRKLTVEVHHSRVLHITGPRLISEVKGRPRLRPIINRLEDLEKMMGGSAEMYWRGARPGYHAKPMKEFTFGDEEISQLEDELDKFEHDLRRVLTAEGIEDFQSLAQQIADPSKHVDIQLQAISAQTEIPKRILVGSERGELSSSQDQDQWNTLITTRREGYAEADILRPFIDVCMEHGILPNTEDYNIVWEDLFAPSDEDKVKVGEIRARALKEYVNALGADEILPRKLVYKHLLGLSEEDIDEAEAMIKEAIKEEDRIMGEAERMVDEIEAQRQQQPPMAPGGGNNQPPPRQRETNGQQL